MTGAFLAGGATADITPGWALQNYNGQLLHPSEEPSPLLAHVLVCTDGSRSVAIVSIDCTFADRSLVLRIRDEIQHKVGVDPNNVVVASTHDHNTPATSVSFLSGALPDPLYLDFLCQRIGEAAERAARGLDPAVLVAGVLHAPPIAHCRRRIAPSGQSFMLPDAGEKSFWPAENQVDHEMQYLAFETPKGRPIAIVLNVAIHNNITFGLDRYHCDMFGRAGQIIRDELGQSIPVLTLAAPCGDVCWCGPDLKPAVEGDDEDERAWAAGRAIAAPILGHYSRATRYEIGKLVAHSSTRFIADRCYKESDFCQDGCRGTDEDVLERMRLRYDPEEEWVKARKNTSCVVEVQALAFGPAAIVTNPAELFSVYGMAIKAQSPFEVTLVSELTNGYCGYVPTEEAFDHRGYETHRTVYTSRLVREAGDEIARMSIALLFEVRQHYSPDSPEVLAVTKLL